MRPVSGARTDLPVEQPGRFDLAVNLDGEGARPDLPQSVLLQATRAIECLRPVVGPVSGSRPERRGSGGSAGATA